MKLPQSKPQDIYDKLVEDIWAASSGNVLKKADLADAFRKNAPIIIKAELKNLGLLE